jgi:hypothetical protein
MKVMTGNKDIAQISAGEILGESGAKRINRDFLDCCPCSELGPWRIDVDTSHDMISQIKTEKYA